MQRGRLSSRREVMAGLLGVGSLLPSRIAMAAPAHTFKLGAFEITVLSDGHLTIPTRLLARNVGEAEIKSAIGLGPRKSFIHVNRCQGNLGIFTSAPDFAHSS